ncbi:hypothetical protein N9C20_02170 [Luminiphilus sp.]|nr:hypothetical protein [Luminiphilus sp.]
MTKTISKLVDKKIRAADALAKTALIVEPDDPSLSSFLLRRSHLYLKAAIKQRDREIAKIRENYLHLSNVEKKIEI